MKPDNKDNISWKLDLLETKFLNRKPRYQKTKTLLNAKSQKTLASIVDLASYDIDSASQEIEKLKAQLAERKYHSGCVKLARVFKKLAKSETNKVDLKLTALRKKNEKDPKIEKLGKEAEILKKLDFDIIVHSKMVKLSQTLFRKEPPQFLPEWCRMGMSDEACEYNPKRLFKQSTADFNNVLSQLSNHGEIRETMTAIEASIKLILGERDMRKKEPSLKIKADVNDLSPVSDDEPIDEDDHLLASASEDESDVESPVVAKVPSRDSAEKKISEVDDFFHSDEKRNLPSLATGYFSGGESDSEVDRDEVVEEATKPRKNRRGQRARQKIWEAKYGNKAKHVQEEKLRQVSEREKKQLEFEQRQRKREEKAKNQPEQIPSQPYEEKPMHPSWIAKRKLQESNSGVQFSGKKICFD